MNSCVHCSNGEHNLVCNCGHTHSQHVFRGGCSKCTCTEYSQTSLREENEDQSVKKVPGSFES